MKACVELLFVEVFGVDFFSERKSTRVQFQSKFHAVFKADLILSYII